MKIKWEKFIYRPGEYNLTRCYEQGCVFIEQFHGSHKMCEQIEKEIYRAVETLMEELKVTNYVVDIKPGSVTGDNYLGVISSVQICGLDEEGNKKSFNFIVKSSQKNEEFRKVIHAHHVFANEVYIYTNVLPVFERFQKEKFIDNPFKSYTKLYKYNLEDINELLIMENMKELGYALRNRLEPLDYHHTSLIMKEYGRLHALSFALRDQKPEDFKKLAVNLQEKFFHQMDKTYFDEDLHHHYDKAIKTLDPQEDKAVIENFKNFTKNASKLFLNSLTSEAAGKHGVIVHGDCWINNILYKYDNSEEPEIPTKVCILDWQLSCIASPALDLSYFLFTSTDKELRDKHLDLFFEQYYNSLSSFLAELGSDAQTIFPWKVFQEHMRKFSVYGLLMSLMVIKLMLTEKDEAMDFSEMTDEERKSAALVEIKNSEVYNKRIRGILQDFHRLDYF